MWRVLAGAGAVAAATRRTRTSSEEMDKTPEDDADDCICCLDIRPQCLTLMRGARPLDNYLFSNLEPAERLSENCSACAVL